MKQHYYILATALFVLLASGCGIRPKTLEPPPDAEDREYPRTYPDLSNDPQPHSH